MTVTTINGRLPVCVEHRVPLAYCPHGIRAAPTGQGGPASYADHRGAATTGETPVVASPRWSPARLAYAFYAVAAAGAVAGQVWVAVARIDWSPGTPMWLRVAAVLPFAACLELLAMALAAMADQRMRAGERAYGFRAFSAVVAVLAVGILVAGHWPHYYLVAAFGSLSTSAYALWLLHAGARRRDALRAAGQLATVAPAYGWWRRLRHPILTARAAELARERGLGLYASLREAELALRAEARRPAIAAAVEDVVRGDHDDPRMAEIAVQTLDLDRVAVELEARADYTGWADRLAPAVLASRPEPGQVTPGHAPNPPAGTGRQQPTRHGTAADKVDSEPPVPGWVREGEWWVSPDGRQRLSLAAAAEQADRNAQVQEPGDPAASEPARQASGRRATKRANGRTKTAADKVAAARARNPHATQAEVARRTKVSARTVARYWRDTEPATGHASGPDDSPDGRRHDGVPVLADMAPDQS